MRKTTTMAIFAATLFLSFECFAGVRFIVDSAPHTARTKTKHTSQPVVNECKTGGYLKTSCPDGEQGVEVCPSNGNYFKYCCPAEYMYSKQDCYDMGARPGRSCHGYYTCEEEYRNDKHDKKTTYEYDYEDDYEDDTLSEKSGSFQDFGRRTRR